jgi:hypothetical protein
MVVQTLVATPWAAPSLGFIGAGRRELKGSPVDFLGAFGA